MNKVKVAGSFPPCSCTEIQAAATLMKSEHFRSASVAATFETCRQGSSEKLYIRAAPTNLQLQLFKIRVSTPSAFYFKVKLKI